MASKIKETPILYGKEAREFLDKIKNSTKVSKEELDRIKNNYELLKNKMK